MIFLKMTGDLPVGRIIEQQRLKAHLTQRQLGQMLDVSASTVTRWEQGSRAPSLETFRKILNLTGADIQVIER